MRPHEGAGEGHVFLVEGGIIERPDRLLVGLHLLLGRSQRRRCGEAQKQERGQDTDHRYLPFPVNRGNGSRAYREKVAFPAHFSVSWGRDRNIWRRSTLRR